MALNDQLYSRLVNLYQDLDDQQIHKLNAQAYHTSFRKNIKPSGQTLYSLWG